jgi:general secretion pathway protein E
MAQRLVRKLCPACAVPDEVSGAAVADELADAGYPDLSTAGVWRRAGGCRECQGTGYKRRVALYEVVAMNEPLREAVLHRMPTQAATHIARDAGFRSLRQDGLLKAAAGITSLDEVIRVTGLNSEG